MTVFIPTRCCGTYACYTRLTSMTIQENSQLIADFIVENCQGRTLLLVSGGSSAKVGIKVLQLLPINLLNSMSITLTDERFVPFESPDSNWNLLLELGLNDIDAKKIAILNPDSNDRNKVSADYCFALTKELSDVQNVVAVFGIGTDNHIAGILPNSAASNTLDTLVTDYSTDNFERITITPAFFEKIDYAFIYAEGAAKQPAVSLIGDDLSTSAYPDQLIKKTKHWEVLYNKEAL